jgi:hypothetical protein
MKEGIAGTREALIADIHAAVRELADGRNFPDLHDAIDQLAALPAHAGVSEAVACPHGVRLPHACNECADEPSAEDVAAWMRDDLKNDAACSPEAYVTGFALFLHGLPDEDGAQVGPAFVRFKGEGNLAEVLWASAADTDRWARGYLLKHLPRNPAPPPREQAQPKAQAQAGVVDAGVADYLLRLAKQVEADLSGPIGVIGSVAATLRTFALSTPSPEAREPAKTCRMEDGRCGLCGGDWSVCGCQGMLNRSAQEPKAEC